MGFLNQELYIYSITDTEQSFLYIYIYIYIYIEYMCFNQKVDISILNDGPLKLVDEFA